MFDAWEGSKKTSEEMRLLGATALCFICMRKLVYYFDAEIEKKKKMKMKKVYSFIKHPLE